MGDPATFYPGNKWNPDGYFELQEIHGINIPLVNGIWWKFSYFWLPSTKTILKRAARRSEKIREAARKYCGLVVKDTRFCLTLPAWMKCGARVERILVCLRHPYSVARSIQKRNPTLLRHGYTLWVAHNERLLSNARGIELRFINYHNLLDPGRFAAEMGPAFRFFGIDIAKEDMERVRARTVKPQMDHNRTTEVNCPKRVHALWEKLLALHAAQFRARGTLNGKPST